MTETAPELPIPPKMAAAVQAASWRCAGIHIATAAAEEIARAVLECADGEYHSLQSVQSDMWEHQDVRDSLRQHMRRELFVKLADEGLLPAGWPRELVGEFAGVAGGMVDVELIVPVRRVIP
jgi:alkylation response protein AidB-like acyl-CoA dehydrogenase